MKCILPLIIALFIVNILAAQPNYGGVVPIYKSGTAESDQGNVGGTTGVNTMYFRTNGTTYSHTNRYLSIPTLGTSGWLTQFNDDPTSEMAGSNIDTFLYQGYNRISGNGTAMFDYVHFNIGASNTMEIASYTPMYIFGGPAAYQYTPPGGIFIAKRLAFNNGLTTTDFDYNPIDGAIVFINSADYTNTSGAPTDAQHVNGYVTEYNNANNSSGAAGHGGNFTFPVGNASEVYQLQRSGNFNEAGFMLSVAWLDGDPGTSRDYTGIEGYQVEDYDGHPVNAGTLTGGIAAVAAVGFWDWHYQSSTDNNYTAVAMSADQTITVSIPDLTAYTGSPAGDLRLVGFNANTGKWVNLSVSGATGVTKGSTLTGTIPAGTTITMLAIGSVSIILPVTFSEFTVKAKDCKALLEWKTSMEQNNSYFKVERSTDGRNFSAIAQTTAVGNSNTTQTYNYTDESPLTGVNYYRITQVDFDGKYTSTAIRSIKISCTVGAGIVKAYPNPASNQLYIQSGKAVAQVNILSSNGQNVLRFVPSTNQGGTFPMNVQMLPGGIYLIQVVNKDGTADIIKMVKK